ncbi:MAG: Do family serine endopeptidase [Deltaproteobacteria bacterium]|nr:Do family serine endopeptidase [Deltaproteobacteria bacterium]
MRVNPLALIALLVLQYGPAQARSGDVWSEKGAGAPTLAQVPDFAALAKQVSPAVVAINVEQKMKMGRGGPGMGQGMPPGSPFEYFFGPFGGEVPHEFRGRGLGSGFVINRDGLILTNNHVIEDADSIEVVFDNGDGTERKLAAKVLGTAPDYDVALIQTVEKANAPITYLGNSDAVNIGDWTMAVGNPFGLSHTVSVGIISAKERRDVAPSGRQGLYDFIQTDAAINPGNSGGPLVNMKGEVIGINSAINAAGSGIGFAIPINMVKEMLPDLKAKGKFTRSWIGIKIQPLSSELAESYGLKSPNGALVAEVVDGSPADKAGIQGEDVVLEFDGKPVRNSTDLPLFASMAGVGRKVELKVWRKGSEKRVSVTLQEYPDDEKMVAKADAEGGGGELGLTVADVSPKLQRQFGLEADSGVIIKDIDPNGVAARARLRPGDVIVSFNGKAVKTAREFAQGVRALGAGAVIRLQVNRGNGRLFVAFRKP